LPVDRVLDRVHAAVGKEGVDDARMVTPGGDGGVGRTTVVLVLGAHVAIEGRCAGWRHGVWGQGRGETVVERVAVAPVGVAAAQHSRGSRGELASRYRGRRDARKYGSDVGVRQRSGRAGWRNRPTVMVGRHVRLHLRAKQRVAEPIGERSKLPAGIWTEGTRVWPTASEAAEGVPSPLTPTVIRDTVRRGHASSVRAGERLLIGLARADEN